MSKAPRSILVVDDEADTRRTVIRFLKQRFGEYRTVEAEDGDDALARLSPDVALVICDVNMPVRDGFSFCRTVRTDSRYGRFASIPIVLLTARDQAADLVESWDAGSTLHVTKPIDPRQLEQALSTIVDA